MPLFSDLSVAESILLFVGTTTPILAAILWAVRRFVMLEDRVKSIEKRLRETSYEDSDLEDN